MKKISLILISLILLSSVVFALTFDSKEKAESYINTLSETKKGSLEIVDVQQNLGSSDVEVFWKVTVWQEHQELQEQCSYDEETFEESCEDVMVTVIDNVLHEEVMSSSFPEGTTPLNIAKGVKAHAKDWYKVWKQQQKVNVYAQLIGQKQRFDLS